MHKREEKEAQVRPLIHGWNFIAINKYYADVGDPNPNENSILWDQMSGCSLN